ncbi:NAD-dependent epimerase/dehydratase family protein [Pleurocapsa sp. FMAR1]|uniref:NAD-dependent epimerase/dehydratase family protein n=1 Tax=Pleurocapsa sp. FMAR1 TaxID=3040204 RepID=UPI0029C7FD45|nr:NAD-dependent epimerase/dehydratase family protein [Pleurocapsa sp. FMAR1]
MKALIIGCGYVGSKVARLWHEAGNEVTVTTTTPSKRSTLEAIADKVVILTGDDLATLKQVLADREVVLLSVGAKQRSQEGYTKAYLKTAKNVVTALKTNDSVKQLIYTSSYGILSNQNGDTVDEAISVNPATEIGQILHQTEKVLFSASEKKLNICIFRLSGIYGTGRELIKIFKGRAGTTRPGEGKDYTNWIHVDDIARAIAFAQQQQLQGIYNLTSDEVLTTKEFFQKLFQAHNLTDITWDSSQTSSRTLNLKLSNQKLKDAGFKFTHPQIEFE